MDRRSTSGKNKIFDPALITAGIVFVFITILTRSLTVNGNIVYSIPFLAVSLSASAIIGTGLGVLLGFLLDFSHKHIQISDETEANKRSFFVFPVSFIIVLISFIPYFLAYFPGILAYDSYIQIGQILNGQYNEHHPLFHTLLIKFSLETGNKLFGSLNSGVAIYALLQCILLSAVFAYGIFVLHRRGQRVYSLLVLLLTALFPFNGYMAVSVTKDIPFSAFFLLSVILISEIPDEKRSSFKYIKATLLFISALLCVLFRNNAKYAYAFLASVFIIILIVGLIGKNIGAVKNVLIIFLSVLLAIGAGLIILTVLSGSLGAVQGDRREMLSVPIQQLARTYVYHAGVGVMPEDDNTMDEESKALINEFLLYDSACLYRQDISDPVKRNTNTWVVVNKTGEFAKTYLKLLKKYPGDYINAFLALNAGFLDIGDESHAHINENPPLKGLGYVQTRWSDTLFEDGFSKDPKWEYMSGILDKWAEENFYLNIPILKYIFMPGVYLWIYIVFAINCIRRKNMKAAGVLALVTGYYITMFFGPCVQLRYIYPVMITVPFLTLYGIRGKSE
ncbi:MAG: DUF6020 family protein [Lachnospiraceae bacterium]|nr:DUF6020 family protein [Lachnospiraceae bacterium]